MLPRPGRRMAAAASMRRVLLPRAWAPSGGAWLPHWGTGALPAAGAPRCSVALWAGPRAQASANRGFAANAGPPPADGSGAGAAGGAGADARATAASSGPEPEGAGASASSPGRGGTAGDRPRPGEDLGPDSGELRRGGDNVQFTWRSAVFTCVVAGGCLGYYDYLKRRKESESRAVTRHERIGTPRLGGSFELVDRKGETRTDEDLKGQYLLIYFGFTFCPDICPQEMEKQTRVIELLDKALGQIATPVFISVDPKRDSPAQVDDYCKEFHPRLVGLTGTPEQVKSVSRAYRVYYNEGVKNSEKDYLIDHSIIHYFVGKNGKFIDFFGKNMTAQEMADKMRQHILQDQEKAKQRKQRRGVESADPEE